MHKLKEYMLKADSDPAKKQELEEVACDAIEKLRKYCPDISWETAYKLHCIVYGPHFDEALAKKAVAEMKNVDGTRGAHWTYEDITALASQNGIKEVADLYYLMNMFYSDYKEVLGSDVGVYLKMAKAYMNDPDAPKGKAFRSWVARIKE